MTAWQPHVAFPNGLGHTWPLVARDFPIAVCWAHKSANTTMLKWFLFHTGLLDRATAEYPDQFHLFWYAHSSAQPDYAEQCFRALEGPTRKLTVKVIRNPSHRAVSGFLHFVRDPKVGFRDTWADFMAWKRATGRETAATATFIEFLQFILDTRRAGQPIDLHAQPQWNPLQDPYVRHHIPLEDLASHLHWLEHLCGLRTSPLQRLSRSPHHSPPAKGRPWPQHASSLPLDKKRLRLLGTPECEWLLDDASLPLVREAFAIDYTAYARFYAPVGDTAAQPLPSGGYERRQAA